ncbi:MAG: ribosome small subunit-dependent GTPase A [Proteobacteria bacterium]|nr:ribosome small subunit-dependent GTPase A [Pseudomonadota bacterium]
MTTRVRIVAEHRGAYKAVDEVSHDPTWVELPGKTFHAAGDKRDLPTVGDYVVVDHWERARSGGGAAVVLEILPRRSFLVRKAAGEAVAPQPLASNVDTGVVMTSANADLSPARLDRYLGLLRAGNIAPVLVLSKIDLVDDPAPILAKMRAVVANADVPVIAISAPNGSGLDDLLPFRGRDQTIIILGSSGVGKSTLLNAVAARAQVIGGIRADERGRHTTTHRELFVAADGTSWIDTPGMRELAQWLDDDDEIAFDDVAALAASCKFRDCTHHDEPGCAVRGVLAPARLASFQKLATERRDGTRRRAEAERLATTRKAQYHKAKKTGAKTKNR